MSSLALELEHKRAKGSLAKDHGIVWHGLAATDECLNAPEVKEMDNSRPSLCMTASRC